MQIIVQIILQIRYALVLLNKKSGSHAYMCEDPLNAYLNFLQTFDFFFGISYSTTKPTSMRYTLDQYRGSKSRKTSRRKGVCSYGHRRKGRCPSKKEAMSRKSAAAKRIQKAFRKSRK